MVGMANVLDMFYQSTHKANDISDPVVPAINVHVVVHVNDRASRVATTLRYYQGMRSFYVDTSGIYWLIYGHPDDLHAPMKYQAKVWTPANAPT